MTSITIRAEQAGDEDGICLLNQQAFPGREAELVDLLRARGRNIVSLLALQDEQVIGQVLFSEVTVMPATRFRGVGLAPAAVLPGWQRQGIGSQLIRLGLKRCAELGYDFSVVLGHVDYYPRFGYRKASLFGLANRYGVDEPFMALAFRPGVLGEFQGVVEYQPEFTEIDLQK